ncbi:MAG: hypothetical protein PHZ00_04265, partial [Candidatus Peribacteraceae bacterium]|nr:hypothetical protein [Candidatus Peribacteraceae bacterium]
IMICSPARTVVLPIGVATEIAGNKQKAAAWVKQQKIDTEFCRITLQGGLSILDTEEIRQLLESVLSPGGLHVRSAENVALETTSEPPTAPFIMEPETLLKATLELVELERFNASELPSWEQHLKNAQASLAIHRQQRSIHRLLNEEETRSRLVGYCAEIVFHSYVRKLCDREHCPQERRIRMAEPSDFHHVSDHYQSCSIRPSDTGSFLLCDGDGNRPEMDDIVLTGLDPDKPHTYCGMYLFDVTASAVSFRGKMQHGRICFQRFIEGMRKHGCECDFFNVLLYDPQQSLREDDFMSSDERIHAVKLPLLPEANMLAQKTFDALDERHNHAGNKDHNLNSPAIPFIASSVMPMNSSSGMPSNVSH